MPQLPDATYEAVLRRLEKDGLCCNDGRPRTTRRWHAAMMRPTASLMADPGDRVDVRIPIVKALLDLYGDRVTESELVDMVGAMLRIDAEMRGSANRGGTCERLYA